MSKLNDVAFSIIANAGDARSKLTAALKEAREGNFSTAKGCLKDAEAKLLKAHETQTAELLRKEADGAITEPVNVVVVHAQDYVMTSMAMKELVAEVINLYEKLESK